MEGVAIVLSHYFILFVYVMTFTDTCMLVPFLHTIINSLELLSLI